MDSKVSSPRSQMSHIHGGTPANLRLPEGTSLLLSVGTPQTPFDVVMSEMWMFLDGGDGVTTCLRSFGEFKADRDQTNVTCDCLPKLLVSFTQDANETRDSARVYQRRLVVAVLIDEVPCGASGVSQHSPVVAGEELNQGWNSMQITDLVTA